MKKIGRVCLSRLFLVFLVLPVLHSKAATPQETNGAVAIVGGRVHTVSGAVLEGATVLIESGRIRAVGTQIPIPAAARRIDAAGKVVTPGFIVAESQLGLVEVSLEAETRDASVEDPVMAAFRVTDGLNPHSTLIPITRVEGITTAISAPGGGLVAGQSAAIDLISTDFRRMVVRSPAGMHVNFGPFRGARGAASLRLRELLEDARFYRANRFRYDTNQTRDLSASRLDLQALVRVLENEMPLVVRASRMSDIQAVLAMAEEFAIRLILSGGEEAWMLAEELAARQVPVIVGQLSNLPSTFGSLGQRFDNAALLHRAGVKIALVNPSAHDARRTRQEAGNAVRHGLPWEAALRAVTLSPAEMFGLEETRGSLEAGKVANVVVWSGDPFEFATQVEHVFIRGEDVCCFSRQRELLRRYRTLDRNQPPAYR